MPSIYQKRLFQCLLSATLVTACVARPPQTHQAPALPVPSVAAEAKSSRPGPTAAPAPVMAPLPASDELPAPDPEPDVASSTAPEESLAKRLEVVVGGSLVRSASSAAGARARSVPRLVRKTPTVGPSYPPDLIKTMMRRRAREFAKCITGAPSSGPRRALRFTIDANGRAQDVSWGQADEAKLDAGQNCVLDVIRGMQFVPPRGPVHVSYP